MLKISSLEAEEKQAVVGVLKTDCWEKPSNGLASHPGVVEVPSVGV